MEFCTRISNQLMLKEVEEGNSNKNLVSSPLSINAVLYMVAIGSKGHTLEKLLGFLGAKDIEDITSKATEMMAAATGSSSEKDIKNCPILAMVNGAWVDLRFPLQPSYEEDIKRTFKCEAKNVDFKTKAGEAVKEINAWANSASKGLIDKILQPDSLSPETSLILANGLYFKGIWNEKHKFDAASTKKRKFYLLNGDTVSVPFMTSYKKYHYESFDGFKVLEIPYQSKKQTNNFTMYFFLPNERDGLQNLLENFSSSDSGILPDKYFKLRQVELKEFWIPKFKFSFDFNVSTVMESMGASLSVVKNPQDLSEMMHVREGVPFYQLKMFQKAYIEIDEKGAEAAAITHTRLICGAARPPPKVLTFVADHPFTFMIKEEKSGLLYFTGAVLNPIQSRKRGRD